MDDVTSRRDRTRSRVVEVAARLLHESGPAAVTTRAVAEAAGVQPPAIYRLFGHKDGLLEAVAEHVMLTHASTKAATVQAAHDSDVDPLEDLRTSFTSQITFGLSNPALFRLLSDPERVTRSPAADLGRQVLRTRVHRVASTGRLQVSEQRAVDLLQAAGIGAIHTLLAAPPRQRDTALADDILDAVLARILTDAPPRAAHGPLAAAVALRAVAPHLASLSAAEQLLLDEWLKRAIDLLET